MECTFQTFKHRLVLLVALTFPVSQSRMVLSIDALMEAVETVL